MVSLSSKNIQDIKKICSEINAASDMDSLRQRVVPLVHRAFDSTSTIFWKIDDSNRLVDPVLKGIQPQYLTPYTNYFFDKNPFDPENIPVLQRPSVLMEELAPLQTFQRTEYYNDFIKPQSIQRQMAVYIHQDKKMTGVIGMHRSSKNSFGKTGLFMGDMMTQFLTGAFERIHLQQQIAQTTGLFHMIGHNIGLGILVLDENMEYTFSNAAADSILEVLGREHPLAEIVSPINIPGFIPAVCRRISAVTLPFYQTSIQCSAGNLYRIKWQAANGHDVAGISNGFVISFEKPESAPDKLNLKKKYHLTDREIQIVSCLEKGLTNNEIAKSLFISPGTVKNHLKHIFTKTGAANRTQAVHIAFKGAAQKKQ